MRRRRTRHLAAIGVEAAVSISDAKARVHGLHRRTANVPIRRSRRDLIKHCTLDDVEVAKRHNHALAPIRNMAFEMGSSVVEERSLGGRVTRARRVRNDEDNAVRVKERSAHDEQAARALTKMASV